MTSTVCIVLCTCPDKETANNIADNLIDNGLAACVNITSPIISVYRWKGRRERSEETLLIVKTDRRNYDRLENAILELHPYELPEVIAVPVEQGLTGYLRWVTECSSDTR